MADVPSGVNYGRVRGRAVSFLPDSNDAGEIPDEAGLTGSFVIEPAEVGMLTFAGLNPPRQAFVQPMICPIIDGWLCAPGTTEIVAQPELGFPIISTDQPLADIKRFQFKGTWRLTNVAAQPKPFYFEVPPNSLVDIATVVQEAEQPAIRLIVTHSDRVAVEEMRDQIQIWYDEWSENPGGGGGGTGTDGESPQLQVSGSLLQTKLPSEVTWTTLFDLSTLEGAPGTPGMPGTNGQEVSLQTTATHIQWRLGTGAWQNLVTLASLKGADGVDGADGQDGAGPVILGPTEDIPVGLGAGAIIYRRSA